MLQREFLLNTWYSGFEAEKRSKGTGCFLYPISVHTPQLDRFKQTAYQKLQIRVQYAPRSPNLKMLPQRSPNFQ